MSLRACAAVVFVVCVTGLARGQSFNVDINFPGAGFTAPSNSYGAAMGTTGVWNAYAPGFGGATMSLVNTSGAATAVTVRMSTTNGFSEQGNGSGGGSDYDRLMNDFVQTASPGQSYQVIFQGVTPGYYEGIIYDYGGRTSGQNVNYEVLGSQQSIDLTSSSYGLLRNGHEYARFGSRVFSTGTYANAVVVMGRNNESSGWHSPTGFQLRRVTHLYVAGDAPAGGSGGSWDSPLNSVRAALDLAAFDSAIGEVWIKRGTYAEFTSHDGALSIPASVTVRGGFAGTETAASQRPQNDDPYYRTVIDGAFGPTVSDEVYHVLKLDGVQGVTLDRLTLRNGHANGPGDEARGGGLFLRNGSVIALGCRFESCDGNSGGGAYIEGSVLICADCVFDSNGGGSLWGGAAFVTGVSGDVSSFTRCRFTRNSATTLGGGALLLGGTAHLADCLFAGNASGANGGAVMMSTSQSVTMERCTAVNNAAGGASGQGGGVYASTGGGTYQLRDCVIWGNTAPGGSTVQSKNLSSGAGTTFDFCTIQGNSGTAVGGNNGLSPGFVNGFGADGVVGTDDDRWDPAPGSSMIDSGSTAVLSLSSGSDLAGHSRMVDDPAVANSGSGTPPIDRGCYEKQNTVAFACGRSDMGSTGGVDGFDGTLDNNDFIAFINRFFAADPRADLGRAGGLNGADGVLDNNDFIVFINAFFIGCS